MGQSMWESFFSENIYVEIKRFTSMYACKSETLLNADIYLKSRFINLREAFLQLYQILIFENFTAQTINRYVILHMSATFCEL